MFQKGGEVFAALEDVDLLTNLTRSQLVVVVTTLPHQLKEEKTKKVNTAECKFPGLTWPTRKGLLRY